MRSGNQKAYHDRLSTKEVLAGRRVAQTCRLQMHKLHASANWHDCSAILHGSLTLMPGHLVRLVPCSKLPITSHNNVIMLNLKYIEVLLAKCLLQSLPYKQTRSV